MYKYYPFWLIVLSFTLAACTSSQSQEPVSAYEPKYLVADGLAAAEKACASDSDKAEWNCITANAIKTRNPDACEDIKGERSSLTQSSCYAAVAATLGDAEICATHANEPEVVYNNCLYLVNMQQALENRDASYCDSMDSPIDSSDHDGCLRVFASTFKDASYCDGIKPAFIKSTCQKGASEQMLQTC